jgi:hypothetical protein
MPQVQSPRPRRGLVGGHRDIFCVKAAFWILPVVGIDLIAHFQPSHPRADRGDDAGAVEAEHERKMRFAAGIPSVPDVGVPPPDARGIDGDQDFTGIDGRHRQSVSGDHLRSAKLVDRRGEHRARHMHGVMGWSNNVAGTIEHDCDLAVGLPFP